jgi:hypothetical protein
MKAGQLMLRINEVLNRESAYIIWLEFGKSEFSSRLER